MDMPSFEIQPLSESWQAWAMALLVREWGAVEMVTRGRVHDLRGLPGFVALRASAPLGLATYRIEGDECELMSLNSLAEGQGVGTALIQAVRAAAARAGCRRLWLITTNDNLHALGFYQRRGFRLAALYPNALEASRRIKPGIPLVGMDGIPLRDEIELESPVLR